MTDKIRNEEMNHLFEAVLTLKDEEECLVNTPIKI